jgi:hypothetical protein
MIFGLLLLAGDTGAELETVGAAGGLESSTYVTELLEQFETLPAASVAVAQNVVVELSATEAEMPAPAKVAAPPVPATALVHALSVYRFTVEPASAEPMTIGPLLLAGEAGDTDVSVGFAGAFESST